jgi:hypothetical protein
MKKFIFAGLTVFYLASSMNLQAEPVQQNQDDHNPFPSLLNEDASEKAELISPNINRDKDSSQNSDYKEETIKENKIRTNKEIFQALDRMKEKGEMSPMD